MRRYLFLGLALMSLTSIGCPPAPKDDPVKPGRVKITDKADTPIEAPDGVRTRIEDALKQVRDRDLLTTHAFWTVFHGILGTGPDKTMLTDPKTKKRVRAIDYICAGGEIRGMQFAPTQHGLDVIDVRTRPDLQFVAQGHQDQFIAEMAQWGIKKDRKFRVAGRDYTFDDFVRQSRMRASVKQQQELSWAIIIVAQFYGTGPEPWVNSFGETLNYHDVVRYELNASIDEAACGGTHRLFGLTWAYHLHLKNGGKKEGVWKDVEARIDEYKEKALKMQNGDGVFSTDYFKTRDFNPDPQSRISTTGHIVEWLALAMTDEELRDRRMQYAVNALAMLILDAREQNVESGALYHAAHGLHLYHERVFGTPAAYLPLPPRK
ncbi:MAG: hypothetical protein HYX68_01010 [Planctomycetes bacterium]|nr:hypothetical protein [Planctomycetota bacterium]